MDAKKLQLREKLESLLQEATRVASELQAIDQGGRTPHFDQLELPAHELGKRLISAPFCGSNSQSSPRLRASA